MSKKKNTLKDLDEFLKQQAATLVSPERINDSTSAEEIPAQPVNMKSESPANSVSANSIVADLHHLAKFKGASFKKEFYEIILQVLKEQNDFSPEDKMLINTVLYLKHGADWKEAIRDFWKSRAI